MLNLKKLFLEAGKMSKIENSAYFEKDVFFSKNDTFRVFRIFRPEGSICRGLKVDFRDQQLKLYQMMWKKTKKKI